MSFEEGEGVEFRLERLARFEAQQDRLIKAIKKIDAATGEQESLADEQEAAAGDFARRAGSSLLRAANRIRLGVQLKALANSRAVKRGKTRNRRLFRSRRR